MAANIDAILREGIAAYKSGRKDEARSFLLRAVELDQYNEQAWLWLSAVVDTPEDQRTCLENVLAINPENDRARSGLTNLDNGGSAPPAAPPVANDFATSVEWDTAPASDDLFSVPTPPVTQEMSDDDYDDWVANLNLPTAASNAPSIPITDSFSASDPFGGVLFGADPQDDDDLLSGDIPGGDLSNSPFSTLDFETVFGSPEAAAEMPPPPPPPPPTSAGGAPPRGLVMQSPGREANIFGDLDDVDLRSTGVFAQFERDDDPLDAQIDDLDTEALFEYIPVDIQATRLPGTRERYPVLLLVGLVVLVVLNVGALGLLVYRLM